MLPMETNWHASSFQSWNTNKHRSCWTTSYLYCYCHTETLHTQMQNLGSDCTKTRLQSTYKPYGLWQASWNSPQLLQLVQQGHSETPSLLQLPVSSVQLLHELFQKIGFLHAPLSRLFLQTQSNPKDKQSFTITNSQKWLKNTLKKKEKKNEIPEVTNVINLRSLKLKQSRERPLSFNFHSILSPTKEVLITPSCLLFTI